MKFITKKIVLVFALVLTGFIATAQRYAIIDTRYILDKLPDYTSAQSKLNGFSEQWQKEIDEKQLKLDKMYKDFDADQLLLTDDLRKKREDALVEAQKDLNKLQRDKFGFEGELFQKRQELIKPIQDKVYNAVQKLATEKQYDFVLDKSEGITIIFADPKLDKSQEILKYLGVK